MTIGYGLSVLGGLFFLLALGQLLPCVTAESARVASFLLQMAGWFTTAGWVLQRAEARQAPFGSGDATLGFLRKAVSDVCLPLALLALLFLSIVLLLAVMFAPFVVFIFQRLI